MSYDHKCKGGCGRDLDSPGYCGNCGQHWTPARAAADPAGALAWCRTQEHMSDGRSFAIEIAALRSLVRELAAAVEIGLEKPGNDEMYAAMYVVLAKVPDDLKGGSDGR